MYVDKIMKKITAEESFADKCYHLLSEMLSVQKQMARVDALLTEIKADDQSYLKKVQHPIAEQIEEFFEDFQDLHNKVIKINKQLDKLSEED